MAKADIIIINHTIYHISPSPIMAYFYVVWKAFQINLQQKIISFAEVKP